MWKKQLLCQSRELDSHLKDSGPPHYFRPVLYWLALPRIQRHQPAPLWILHLLQQPARPLPAAGPQSTGGVRDWEERRVVLATIQFAGEEPLSQSFADPTERW